MVAFPALLVVDGSTVISDVAELSNYEVTAEIVGPAKGPKINMIHYRNKTGYKRRQGHRQKYTEARTPAIARPPAKPSKAWGTRQWHTRRARRPAATAVTRTR